MNPVHNTISITKTSISNNVLKDGNSVFVRILNTTNTPNKYIASFAGNMFEVTSNTKLLPGTEFRATIKLNGKSLQLIPQKNIEKLSISLFSFCSPLDSGLDNVKCQMNNA